VRLVYGLACSGQRRHRTLAGEQRVQVVHRLPEARQFADAHRLRERPANNSPGTNTWLAASLTACFLLQSYFPPDSTALIILAAAAADAAGVSYCPSNGSEYSSQGAST
jgi:hypothetical protein